MSTLLLTGAGTSGSGAPFDPASITGLAAWFKADALVLSDGDPVAAWADSSANARNLAAAAGTRPVYKTGILNGKPVVRWTRAVTTVGLDATGFTLAQPNMIFAVFTANSAGGTNGSIIYDGGSAGTGRNVLDNAAGADFPSPSGIEIFAGSVLTGPVTFTSAYTKYASALYNGASSQLWLNGTSYKTGNSGAQSLIGFHLGSRFNDVTIGTIDIAECLVYNANLSTSDRQAVENYLKSKYGL